MISHLFAIIGICVIIHIIIGIIKIIIGVKKSIQKDKESDEEFFKKYKEDLFNKYKTYDTSKGFGNSDEWKSGFNKTFGENKSFDFMAEEAKNYDSFGKSKFKGQTIKKEGLQFCKTEQELKTEYRRLMMKYHPDKNGNTKENVEVCKKLNEQYSKLKKKFKK